MKRRNYIIIFVSSFVLIVAFIAGAVYFFTFTAVGTRKIVKMLVSKISRSDYVPEENIIGDLASGVIFQNVEFNDLGFLPKGSRLKVQKAAIDLTAFSWQGVSIELENIRLFLPHVEPIVLMGNLKNGALNFNVFSHNVAIDEILRYVPDSQLFKKIKGRIYELNFTITGEIERPRLSGTLNIEQIVHNDFILTECPLKVDLIFRNVSDEISVFGEIIPQGGRLTGPQTATIELRESQIIFDGDPARPKFNVTGFAKVEEQKIDIYLKGTLEQPDLKLYSDSLVSQDRMLFMLATNKSWKAAENSLNNQQISVDLARDFIDYFVLGGRGRKIAECFGIKDILIKYDATTKGVEVQKSVSEKVSANYGLEQKTRSDGLVETTQKIGGEVKILENLTLEAAKELGGSRADSAAKESEEGQKTDDSLLLRYKKRF